MRADSDIASHEGVEVDVNSSRGGKVTLSSSDPLEAKPGELVGGGSQESQGQVLGPAWKPVELRPKRCSTHSRTQAGGWTRILEIGMMLRDQ